MRDGRKVSSGWVHLSLVRRQPFLRSGLPKNAERKGTITELR